MTKSTYNSLLIEVLHIISPAGRKRIYQDICTKGSNTRLELIDTRYIENQIREKYTNKSFIDLEINWSFSLNGDFVENELKKAADLISSYLSFLANYPRYTSFIGLVYKTLFEHNSILIMSVR